MDAGERHEHLRIMLVSGGGCMKAAYAWGACLALAELGYDKCFECMYGSSSGVLPIVYLLSGNILDTQSLVYEEACSRNFFSLRRPFNILGTRYMRSVLENYPGRGIDVNNVLNHQSKFLIALSEFSSSRPFLLEPQNKEELYEGLRATISMGGAVSDPVDIRGTRYFDGENTIPYVRDKIYAEQNCTHILDLSNQECNAPERNYMEELLLPTLYRRKTNIFVRKAALARFKNRKMFLQNIIKTSYRPVCVVYGDESVGSFDTNKMKLKKTTHKSRNWWLSLLRQ